MAQERRRVHYRGRVQGVGFRYTAARLAPGFGVSGWVRNLPDGRVELEAQGEPDRVRAFLSAIVGEMGSKIGWADELNLPFEADEDPGDFQIRF
jgi:acylphosphatase